MTINDGGPGSNRLSEHVFRNDGTGTFVDVTDQWWPPDQNRGWDDNVVAALDVESDGDADFLIGSLDGPDRLLLNDGTGGLTAVDGIFDGPQSEGTLGMAIADLNGDDRPDVVEGQGEVPGHEAEKIYMASDAVPADSAPPHLRTEILGETVFARVHDNKTPNMPHDWQSITAQWDDGETPMTWYGENLFRATLPADVTPSQICAVDSPATRRAPRWADPHDHHAASPALARIMPLPTSRASTAWPTTRLLDLCADMPISIRRSGLTAKVLCAGSVLASSAGLNALPGWQRGDEWTPNLASVVIVACPAGLT